MIKKSTEETAFFGMAWKTLETIIVNGFQAIIFLFLARILTPSDFGVVALVGAFIAISNVLVNSGLGTAIIQTKEAREIDYSSVLFFSIFIGFIFYILFFILAPKIAIFYEEPIIKNVLRIYATSILFSAISGVQRSILLRELEFKKIFLVSSISVVTSGIISIIMALSGYGIYALVFNSIFVGLSSMIAFFIAMSWWPKPIFSFKRLKVLFNYSYKLLISNLIEVGYNSIFPLLIGKSYSSAQLGYYNNGKQLPSFAASTINASITSVTFSIYSRHQDDLTKLNWMVRHSIIISNFIIFPMMGILALIAEPLITILLTEKWLPSVIYLQLFCIALGLHHQHNIGFQAISAIGRSDIFLKYQLIKKSIGILMLILTIKFGLIYIVLGQVLAAIISVLVSIYPYKKFLNYSISDQLKDFCPYIFITLLMYGSISPITFQKLGMTGTFLSQIFLGILLYIFLAFTFKLKGLGYSQEVFKKYVFKRFSS